MHVQSHLCVGAPCPPASPLTPSAPSTPFAPRQRTFVHTCQLASRLGNSMFSLMCTLPHVSLGVSMTFRRHLEVFDRTTCRSHTELHPDNHPQTRGGPTAADASELPRNAASSACLSQPAACEAIGQDWLEWVSAPWGLEVHGDNPHFNIESCSPRSSSREVDVQVGELTPWYELSEHCHQHWIGGSAYRASVRPTCCATVRKVRLPTNARAYSRCYRALALGADCIGQRVP